MRSRSLAVQLRRAAKRPEVSVGAVEVRITTRTVPDRRIIDHDVAFTIASDDEL